MLATCLLLILVFNIYTYFIISLPLCEAIWFVMIYFKISRTIIIIIIIVVVVIIFIIIKTF